MSNKISHSETNIHLIYTEGKAKGKIYVDCLSFDKTMKPDKEQTDQHRNGQKQCLYIGQGGNTPITQHGYYNTVRGRPDASHGER